jgi:hypothetical protein
VSTILDALQKAEQEATLGGRRGRTGGPPTSEPPRRRGPKLPRWLVAVAVVAVLAVAFVGGVTLDFQGDDAAEQNAAAPATEAEPSAPQQVAAVSPPDAAPAAVADARPAALPAAPPRSHETSGDGARHRRDAAPGPADKPGPGAGAGGANGSAPTTLARVPYLPPGATTESLRPGAGGEPRGQARAQQGSSLRGIGGDATKRMRKREEVQARREAIRQLGEARRTERAALTELAAPPPPTAEPVRQAPPSKPRLVAGAASADGGGPSDSGPATVADAPVAAPGASRENPAPAAAPEPGVPPPAVPAAAPPGVTVAAAPEPPAAQSALAMRRPPTGAPNVAINIVWWSPVDERRMAFVSVDGGSMTQVREGDQVSGLTVKRIYQEMIEFGQGESSFLLRAN